MLIVETRNRRNRALGNVDDENCASLQFMERLAPMLLEIVLESLATVPVFHK